MTKHLIVSTYEDPDHILYSQAMPSDPRLGFALKIDCGGCGESFTFRLAFADVVDGAPELPPNQVLTAEEQEAAREAIVDRSNRFQLVVPELPPEETPRPLNAEQIADGMAHNPTMYPMPVPACPCNTCAQAREPITRT